MKTPFAHVPFPASRSTAKPRRTGLTMMIDMGLGSAFLADHLRVVGPYVDIAKIFVGSARLYDEAVLMEKKALYAEHDIELFIGGQFLEYIFHHFGWSGIAPFLDEVVRIGVGSIEVSDNCIELTEEDRVRLIRMGIDAGLEVHGEIGSKETHADIARLIDQGRRCLDAGCELILVEAAELVREGSVDMPLIDGLYAEFDPDRIMFELPGPWITHVTLNDVYEMQKQLIGALGPDVNLGNVMPDTVFSLEAQRCGIGIAGPK